MTPEAFVALGAGLALVKVKTVMGAVRLAAHGKTFATVGWPQEGWAVVKLSQADQAGFVALSQAIVPEPGRRGKKGVTLVRLRPLSQALANRLLIAAWQGAVAPSIDLPQTG